MAERCVAVGEPRRTISAFPPSARGSAWRGSLLSPRGYCGFGRRRSASVVALSLASPIAGIHDTLFLLSLLVSRWRLPTMRIVGLLLIVPVPFILDRFGQPALIQATVGSLNNWALVL
jgi:hypothetical protein